MTRTTQPPTRKKPGPTPGVQKVKRLVSLPPDVDEALVLESKAQGVEPAKWIALAVTKKFRGQAKT